MVATTPASSLFFQSESRWGHPTSGAMLQEPAAASPQFSYVRWRKLGVVLHRPIDDVLVLIEQELQGDLYLQQGPVFAALLGEVLHLVEFFIELVELLLLHSNRFQHLVQRHEVLLRGVNEERSVRPCELIKKGLLLFIPDNGRVKGHDVDGQDRLFLRGRRGVL